MKRVIAWVLNPCILLTLTMVVGSANLVAGRGVVGDVPPLTLSFWRWFTAVVVVLPFGIRPLIAQRGLLLQHWRLLLCISAIGIAAFNSFLYLGLQTTTALNGSLILAAIPVITVALAWIVFREQIGWRIATGMVSALVGVTIIILQGEPALLLDLAFNRGDILVLVAVLCWAVYSILLGRRSDGLLYLAPQAVNSCKDPGATVAADRVGPSGPLHLIDPSIPEPLAMLLLDCLEAQPHRRKKLAWVARVLASLDRQPTVAAN